MGQAAENLFARIAEARGFKAIEASLQNDINEHWDFLIEKGTRQFRIDVKAMKRMSRHDREVQDRWVWIELHGVRKYDAGWLYGGKADLIAFEKRRSFLLVKRLDLIALVEKIVDFTARVDSAREANYKIYSRPNRCDRITRIEIEKLNSIKFVEWEK